MRGEANRQEQLSRGLPGNTEVKVRFFAEDGQIGTKNVPFCPKPEELILPARAALEANIAGFGDQRFIVRATIENVEFVF